MCRWGTVSFSSPRCHLVRLNNCTRKDLNRCRTVHGLRGYTIDLVLARKLNSNWPSLFKDVLSFTFYYWEIKIRPWKSQNYLNFYHYLTCLSENSTILFSLSFMCLSNAPIVDKNYQRHTYSPKTTSPSCTSPVFQSTTGHQGTKYLKTPYNGSPSL